MATIDLVGFAVLVLASYRMAILAADVDEGGPWNILARLRRLVGVTLDDYSQPYGTTMVSRMILCVYCNSIWIGLFWTLVYFIFGSLAIWLALPLALSGGAVLLAAKKS